MTRGVHKQPARGVSKQPKIHLVLIFPDSSEVRLVWKRPRVGGAIKSSLGKNWRVEEVLQSGTDVYTVRCGPRSHGVTGAQDLAADLLDRARQALSPGDRRRDLPSMDPQAGKRVGMLREKPVVGGPVPWVTEAIKIGRSVLGVLKREGGHVRLWVTEAIKIGRSVLGVLKREGGHVRLWVTEAIKIGRSVLGVLKREGGHVRLYLHRFRREHPDTGMVLVSGLAALGLGFLIAYL